MEFPTFLVESVLVATYNGYYELPGKKTVRIPEQGYHSSFRWRAYLLSREFAKVEVL
jgi:hypothetical protein